MATNYPAALDNSTTIPVESANTKLSVNHITAHQNIQDAIEAIEAKVGIDGSADTDSLEYKLSDITGSDKAVPNVDGELTTPSLTLGSDATGDLFYRGSDGKVKRLGVGANGKILKVTTNLPAWEDEAVLDDASASVKGVVEIATAAEVDTGTGTGGTGAKIVISPDTLATSIYAGFTKNFGTGADGNLTYDGSTTILGMAPSASAYTLTRDIYANNLTVNAGVTINTGGYRIFVKGTLTLSNATTSIIQNNGGNGGNGAAISGNSGGGGGGAGSGGAGGIIILGSASSSNPYTMTVSGGSAGTVGTGASIGSGVGSNGATGATGATGASYFI